ncbi:MAG: LamG domain-containing protein [Acidobacteria bacterium]|nr:LamG domain-containing protein [Acidobacteriota bacterium]
MIWRTWGLCLLMAGLAGLGCSPGNDAAGDAETAASAAVEALKASLTFHASFDDGPDAAFAKGDRRIYTAPSYEEQASALPGIGNPDVEIVDGGVVGRALKFNKKNVHAIFYRGAKNAAFQESNWTGSVSFWLNLNPDEDLEPGYCDPIQITDSAYNDGAVWVDFTKDDTPRHFRLGVFGDLDSWNPDGAPSGEHPAFLNRLVVVTQPPFARGQWTHVVATYSGLGTGAGVAKLYLDGKLQGTAEDINEGITWDTEKAAFRLGVNYVGLFDEAALFNRALSQEEVTALHELEGGAASIHP